MWESVRMVMVELGVGIWENVVCKSGMWSVGEWDVGVWENGHGRVGCGSM